MGDGAKLRMEYARMRLQRLHAEMIAIEEQLQRSDLSRELRELLTRSRRSKVQSAARWAEMIIDLGHEWPPTLPDDQKRRTVRPLKIETGLRHFSRISICNPE